MIAQFIKSIFNFAEEIVQYGEIREPRAIHESLQAFGKYSREVLAEQLPLYCMDQLPSGSLQIFFLIC